MSKKKKRVDVYICDLCGRESFDKMCKCELCGCDHCGDASCSIHMQFEATYGWHNTGYDYPVIRGYQYPTICKNCEDRFFEIIKPLGFVKEKDETSC